MNFVLFQKKITDFYRDAPDRISFLEKWINSKPFIEKIKVNYNSNQFIEKGKLQQ